MHRVSRSVVAVCAVASLLVTGAGVSPVSAKTINGCVIKAKTKCVKADLKARSEGRESEGRESEGREPEGRLPGQRETGWRD